MTKTREELDQLIDHIAALPSDWHGAGSVSPDVLRAIVRHAARVPSLDQTVETGSGKSTLLFSHLSPAHTVFALDMLESIAKVKASPLFNAVAVTYVEGPTQRTVPRHTFDRPVKMALIDGPHGYPFPDLEYYYLYPTIPTGGVLILDDIQIPTIGRMFAILKDEAMFHLEEVVGTTAFFSRTNAPLLDPFGDGWWLQGFNRSYYDELFGLSHGSHVKAATGSGTLGSRVSNSLEKLVPERLKRFVRRRLT